MIVFTGSGRSGTGLYSKIFNAHHEYNVRGLVGQLRALPGYYNAPSDLLADIRLRRAMMQTHLKGVDLAAFRDSSNPYVHFLDVMHEIDPNIRIVLGVRDGRDFARSGICGRIAPAIAPRRGRVCLRRNSIIFRCIVGLIPCWLDVEFDRRGTAAAGPR